MLVSNGPVLFWPRCHTGFIPGERWEGGPRVRAVKVAGEGVCGRQMKSIFLLSTFRSLFESSWGKKILNIYHFFVLTNGRKETEIYKKFQALFYPFGLLMLVLGVGSVQV
jgi:hypothetical protein